MEQEALIVVRGGGDIASGTIHRLHRCGFRLIVLETAAPVAIRRTVSFGEAVYTKVHTVEGVTAERAETLSQLPQIRDRGHIPVLVDPTASALTELQPFALIDAILAKKNCGTTLRMAPITIGLGPGFYAGKDVQAVIETSRGHDLGRVILAGTALANTGIPGAVQGYTTERVIYAHHAGILTVRRDIGSLVQQNEVIATIDAHPVPATITGLIRGMIRDRSTVRQGLKIADIDPRTGQTAICHTISDKARCISGGVLEALLLLAKRPQAPGNTRA